MKRQLFAVVLAAVLATGVVASPLAAPAHAATHTSAGAVHSHPAAFDKTRFLAHLGAAYFAFHHWVWKPYRDGKLRGFHIVTIGKAALALAFAYHEVKKSYQIAQGSNSKTLQALIRPMNSLAGTFSAMSAKVKARRFSGSDMDRLNSQANGFQSLAKSHGFGFQDQQTSLSGT